MIFFLFLISTTTYLLFQLRLAIAVFQIKEGNPINSSQLPGVSVLIAARNEAQNLTKYLPTILKQDYPKFELIVVLDRCTDDSKQALIKLKKIYPHLIFIEIEETAKNWSGKKWALHQAIAAANFEYLALTDADCWVEKNWLKHIGEHFCKEKTELILGRGLYEREAGLLNQFIRYETLYTCFQYMGFTKAFMPYMGVGRNIAYKKSFFVQNGGFSKIAHRLSGDDDLLVNSFAKKRNTSCMIEAKTASYSNPEASFASWINQKKRHLSASPAYSFKSKFLLGLFHISHLFFYTTAILFI
ncbi:MAG: glycosyltransferase, partial [Bacteroidota bacterium]